MEVPYQPYIQISHWKKYKAEYFFVCFYNSILVAENNSFPYSFLPPLTLRSFLSFDNSPYDSPVQKSHLQAFQFMINMILFQRLYTSLCFRLFFVWWKFIHRDFFSSRLLFDYNWIQSSWYQNIKNKQTTTTTKCFSFSGSCETHASSLPSVIVTKGFGPLLHLLLLKMKSIDIFLCYPGCSICFNETTWAG